MYRIRDWDKHFERDRSRTWKHIKWVPIPNKQGSGYRRIMAQKNGLEIFACWIALVEVASTCEPRGDLTKYTISEISLLTLIPEDKIEYSIKYLSETLDWIEVMTNLDKNVKILDCIARDTPRDSSIQSSSLKEGEGMEGKNKKPRYAPESPEYRMAQSLWEDIKACGTHQAEPDLQAWAKDFDLIHRVDGRPYHWIKKVMQAARADPRRNDFSWADNLRSPQALRKQINGGNLDRFAPKEYMPDAEVLAQLAEESKNA